MTKQAENRRNGGSSEKKQKKLSYQAENGRNTWFKKGVSGNLNGRPTNTKGLTARLREVLNSDGYIVLEVELLDDKGHPTGKFAKGRAKVPTLDVIVYATAKEAAKGKNQKIVEFVWNKFEGTEKTLNINLGMLQDQGTRERVAQELRIAAEID